MIWVGQAFSLFGSAVVQFALIWHLTNKTGLASVLTTATLAGKLPEIFLGPFVGALVDRWNRKTVMIAADGGIALVTLALVMLLMFDRLQIWHIYVALALRSIGSAFHWPAIEASTAMMVPPEHLTRIAGWNTMLYSACAIVGPISGAFLLNLLPLQLVLLVDILGALVACLLLLPIPIPRPQRIMGEVEKPHLLRETAAGWNALRAVKGLLPLTLCCALVSLFESPPLALTPLFVTEHFGGGIWHLGAVETALGIGTFSGSILLGIWGGFRRKIHTVLLACFLSGASFLAMGLLPSTGFPALLVATVTLGMSGAVYYAPYIALLQTKIDPALQGRVISVAQSLLSMATPFALLVAGPTADIFGIQPWFWISGGAILAVTAVCFFLPSVMSVEQADHR